MDKIKNIVFDLGGVLVGLDIDRCRAAFDSIGLEAVAQLINPYHPAEMIGRLEHGQINFHQACDEMRRIEKNDTVTDKQIAWAYGEFLTGVEAENLRLIDALRERGYRTYVLSNNNPSSMHFIREMVTAATGRTMESYFDKMYLSYEMCELKPSEVIFRKMAADGGMNPAETLFIDDSAKNTEAAQQLGFAVHQLLPGEKLAAVFAKYNLLP